ncbi:unnamed protein product, partial [marine sediment metagenome]
YFDYSHIKFYKKEYYEMIFSHEFAKAFWKHLSGSKYSGEHCYKFEDYAGNTISWGYYPDWQYHLQQLVLKREPLKYLEQFLDKDD